MNETEIDYVRSQKVSDLPPKSDRGKTLSDLPQSLIKMGTSTVTNSSPNGIVYPDKTHVYTNIED